MVKYAKCCNPIVGDEIVGYISHGQGVTIHRCNCSNLKYLEQERFIKAEWNKKNTSQFVVNIKVFAIKNPNNIVRITTLLAENKIQIKSFESKETKDEFFCNIAVVVNEKNQIDKIISLMQNLSGISKVERVE